MQESMKVVALKIKQRHTTRAAEWSRHSHIQLADGASIRNTMAVMQMGALGAVVRGQLLLLTPQLIQRSYLIILSAAGQMPAKVSLYTASLEGIGPFYVCIDLI